MVIYSCVNWKHTITTNNVLLLRFCLSACFPFPPHHLQLALKPCVRWSEVSVTCTPSVYRNTSLFVKVFVVFVHMCRTSGPRSPFWEELEGKSTSTHFILHLLDINYVMLCLWHVVEQLFIKNIWRRKLKEHFSTSGSTSRQQRSPPYISNCKEGP